MEFPIQPAYAFLTDFSTSSLYYNHLGFMLLFLLVVFLLVFLWLEFVEIPRQNRHKDIWLEKNGSLLNVEDLMVELLEEFGREVPPCSKCGHSEMQVWDVRNRLMVVRCTQCKVNRTFSLETKPVIGDIKMASIGIYKILETAAINKDEILGQYLLERLRFNYFHTRRKAPMLSAITFNTSPSFS